MTKKLSEIIKNSSSSPDFLYSLQIFFEDIAKDKKDVGIYEVALWFFSQGVLSVLKIRKE